MISKQILLKLLLFLPFLCSAQQVGLASAGANCGFAFPNDGINQNLSLSLESDWYMHVPNTKFSISFDYWKSRKESSDENYKIYSMGLNCNLKNILLIKNYSLIPFYGGGVGIHFNESNHDGSSKYKQDYDLALNAMIGAEYPFNENSTAIAQAKYFFAGQVDFFIIQLGIKYFL